MVVYGIFLMERTKMKLYLHPLGRTSNEIVPLVFLPALGPTQFPESSSLILDEDISNPKIRARNGPNMMQTSNRWQPRQFDMHYEPRSGVPIAGTATSG